MLQKTQKIRPLLHIFLHSTGRTILYLQQMNKFTAQCKKSENYEQDPHSVSMRCQKQYPNDVGQ